MVDLVAGRRIDRYEVVRPLGRGGMAVVFEVRHLDLGTRHALKILQVHAPWLHARLLTEGRIQATLRHPNICRVTDVVRVGDAPGLVMELIDGPPLEALLARYQPNLLQIDQLARGITAGVRAAHEAGLVHRDLKPANVLLEVERDRVVPKVADFGLAKALGGLLAEEQHATRSGATIGTPTYMAPEQFRNAKHADHRADQFSLGCVLYELVCGIRPFSGATPLEVYEAASTGRYRPLRDVAPNVPSRMADAITRAMAADPEDRFADCDAFLAAWCDGVSEGSLAHAWEPDHLALVRLLGQPAVPPQVRSTDTFDGPAPVVQPASPPTAASALAPPSGSWFAADRSGWRLGLGLGVGGLGVGGLVGAFFAVLGFGIAALIWVQAGPGADPAQAAEAPVAAPARADAGIAGTDPAEVPADPGAPDPAVPGPAPGSADPVEVARPIAPVAPVASSPASAGGADPGPEPAPGPPAEAAPADRSTATVVVKGVDRAWLVGPAGRREPGDVPPGKYELHVYFDAGRPTRVLELELSAGQQLEIRCEPSVRVCRR